MSGDWNGTSTEQILLTDVKAPAASPAHALVLVICLVAIFAFSTAAIVYPYIGRMLSTENENSDQEISRSSMNCTPPRATSVPTIITTRDSGGIYVNRMSPENVRSDPNREWDENRMSTSPFHPRFNSPATCRASGSSRSSNEIFSIQSICNGMHNLTFASPVFASTSNDLDPTAKAVTLEGIHARKRSDWRSRARSSALKPFCDAEISRRAPDFLSPTPKARKISFKSKRERRRLQPHPYHIQRSEKEECKRFTARKLEMELPKCITIHKSKGTQTGDVSDTGTFEWDYTYS